MNLMLRPIRKLKTLDSKQKSQNKSLISNKPNKPVIPKIKKKLHSKKFYENTITQDTADDSEIMELLMRNSKTLSSMSKELKEMR